MAAAGFLSSAGARVIDPLLHVVATDFATTVPAVSIVVAAFTLPYGLCQLFLGPFGDRFGKLRVMLAALLAYVVTTASCALAADLPMLTLLRAASGAASAGLIPVAMAYIGDAVPYADRQVTLSRFLTGTVLAQTLAGPIGGIFGEYVGWRGVFLLLAAGAAVVSLAFALRIRALPDPRNPAARFDVHVYVGLARRRTARLLLIGALLDGTVLIGCFPFLAPYLHEAFALRYSSVGLLLACFGVGAFIYTRAARRLLPLLGEPGMVLTGGVLMAGGVALAVLTPVWQAFVLVEILLGLGFFTLHGVMQARATEMLPNARATAVSTFACLLFVGQSIGARAMGILIEALGYEGAFLIDAAAIVALALWLRGVMRRV
jgi:predicted MFS family arabinose efflux permease